jgi:hypothetical protein
LTATGTIAVNCIAANNPGVTSAGFGLVGGAKAYNCVAYGNGGNGFTINSNTVTSQTINCLATANTGYGFADSGAVGDVTMQGCATYNNTAGATSNITALIPGTTLPIALSGDPFVNASGGNFALNNTAGAGAAARGAGTPGTFPGLSTTTGYPDIGAAQSSGGGGSTYIYPIFD